MAQTSLQQAMLRVAPAAAGSGSADGSVAASPCTDIASALQQVASQAAVAFTGSVAALQVDPVGGARVTFQVEQGVRGVASGASYTARVSAWAGGADRFYTGERALFLLTAPSVSGFSAPVMGERGIVPLSGDTLVGNLDLRWIAADVQRGSTFAAKSVTGAPLLRAATTVLASDTSAATPPAADVANSLTLPDVHAIDRDLVLDLLRTAQPATGQTRS